MLLHVIKILAALEVTRASLTVTSQTESGAAPNTNGTDTTEHKYPLVGLQSPRPLCEQEDARATDTETDKNCATRKRVAKSFQRDSLVRVRETERASLLCDTLDKAEDGDMLRFMVSSTEEVTAKRKSFTVWPGSTFGNNTPRKIWTGEVVEEGIPRSIAMSWTGCDVETFFFEMTIPTNDGTTAVMKTVPCRDVDVEQDLCLVKVVREGEDETDIDHSDRTAAPTTARSFVRGGSEVREASTTSSIEPSIPTDARAVAEGSISSARSPSLGGAIKSDEGDDDDGNNRRRKRERRLHALRCLERQVEEGLEAAHREDPDLRDKDEDLRLLNRYLKASPEEQEDFHARGVRRLTSDDVMMPSRRVLSTSTTIDVLVLYTKKARLFDDDDDGIVRTQTQMETEIITAFAGANAALEASGVSCVLNVVHIAEIDFEEVGEMSDGIEALSSGSNEVSSVHALRDEWGADLVQLIAYYPNSCGIGYTMDNPSAAFAKYGYSVVHANCLSNLSHTHEIGHNLGAHHDRENSKSNHEYAFGHRYCTGTNKYRTIMSYESGCIEAPRVNVFSNPSLHYANKAQGTRTADNARVIREATTVAVNFRASRSISTAATVSPEATPQPSWDGATSSMPQAVTAAPAPSADTSIYPRDAPGKWMKWKGCFRDDAADRVMTEGVRMPAVEGVTIGMTRRNCLAYCSNKDAFFKHFGVEFGHECFCWENNDGYKRLGRLPAADCGMPCEGDESSTCGGEAAIEVFKIKNVRGQTEDPDEANNYEGCYRSTPDDRVVAESPVVDYEHAARGSCDQHCSSGGYVYYALEFGFLCQCGDALPDLELQVDDDMCDLPCSDPGTLQTCGGSGFIAVFGAGVHSHELANTTTSTNYSAAVAEAFKDRSTP